MSQKKLTDKKVLEQATEMFAVLCLMSIENGLIKNAKKHRYVTKQERNSNLCDWLVKLADSLLGVRMTLWRLYKLQDEAEKEFKNL